MKNLFNDISQDEKNRILEMHSVKENVISEQATITKGGHKGGPKVNVASSTPNSISVLSTSNSNTTTPKKEIKSGSSINLYSDKDEKTSPKTYQISSITNNFSDGVVMRLQQQGSNSLVFKCGILPLILTTMTKNSEGEYVTSKKYMYNSEVIQSLKSKYCTTNKSGKIVPKVDFSMNNQSTDTTTGIA